MTPFDLLKLEERLAVSDVEKKGVEEEEEVEPVLPEDDTDNDDEPKLEEDGD